MLARLMHVTLQREYNRLGVRGKKMFRGPVEDVIIGELFMNAVYSITERIISVIKTLRSFLIHGVHRSYLRRQEQ
jgi:hypothetical protein